MYANYEHLIAPRLIDSRLKLHLLLQFLIHPGLAATATTLGERVRENPWALAEALEELADAGLLASHGGDTAIYQLGERPEFLLPVSLLAEAFNDPFRREAIYALVKEAHHERQFRHYFAEQRAIGLAGLVIA
ncbi:MAG TPA: hypothetical protein PLO33_01940 [Kouleothrix sp.]|uniref:hypothetical protein n=1 Tax=Kouleothrix sp. TaxID=2779161 RepID=UPI002D1CA133|nr:hypothetical protein [Kouleothrix sp.]HRC74405.1 hypothetical protein [Kouleothrix sp.]